MNELEERLQEQLERLETGESLTTCLEGLSPEETELLTLAVTLQEAAYPMLDSETAVSQRASLQRAIIQNPQQNMASIGVIARLLNWWQAQTAAQRGMIAALSATALVVMLVVFNLDSPFNTEEMTAPFTIESETNDEQSIAQVPAVDSERPSETETTATTSGAAESAAPAVEEPGNAIYIPVVSFPLDVRPQTAVLENIQGVVEMQTEEGAWTAVASATTLSVGQRVRTGALSQVSLTFYDGSQASLGPETEISLDQLDAQKAETGFRTIVMTQWLGESEHNVQFRNDSGSRYEVKTPNGSGIARGTTFRVHVTTDLQAQYTVTKGRVDVTGSNVTVIVTAGKTSYFPAGEAPSQPAFRITGEGEVTQTGPEWIVGGQTFQTDDHTVIIGNPQPGDWAHVEGHLLADGGRMADRIILLHHSPANRFSITGQVDAITPTSWTIAGQTIAVDGETIIEEGIVVGNLVRVDGLIQTGGELRAERIRLVDANMGLPFEFVGVVETVSGNAWTISGMAITTDAHTEIEGDPVVGDVVKVEGVILDDGAWLAHEIKLDEEDENEFEITGSVNSIDPWSVAGVPFETNNWTEMDDNIVVGDLVKVEGIILDDGTWVATEIKLLESSDDLTFTFYGTVDSIDPWVVSGILLPVTEATAVDETIAVGDSVRVQVTLLPDGTWVVEQIALIDDTNVGCFSVTAVVVSLNGDQLILNGWPAISLGDDIEIEGDISANVVIVVNLCIDEDGDITVHSVIVIYIPALPIGPFPPGDGSGKVTLCHKPGKNQQTLTVNQSALQGHLNHGDTLGACSSGGGHDDDNDDHDDDDHDDD